MTISRLTRSFLALAIFVILFTALPATVLAANVGNTAPYPPNSSPNSGSHVFFIRKNPNAGKQKDIKFSAYLPAGANVANARLQLVPGANAANPSVCSVITDPGGTNSQFIQVAIMEPNTMTTRVYNIPAGNVCSQANQLNAHSGNQSGNVLYAQYSFPNVTPQAESKTGMMRFDVVIQYGTVTPPNAGGVRIVASLPANPNGLLSPGTGGYAFPTVGDWDAVSNGYGPQNMTVPFGLCETSNNPITKRIGLYDADNGPNSAFWPNVVRFQVRDLTTNSFVTFNAGSAVLASFDASRQTVIPDNGTNDEYTSAEFQLIPSHFYEMRIYGIHVVNTIDVQIPNGSQSIWGDPNVCQGPPPPQAYDEVTVTSGISQSGDIEVGGSVTFTQNVSVSNFPIAPSQWGFNEEAIRVAWNTDTPPVQTNYDANNAGPTGQSATVQQECADGTWRANCTAGNGGYRCNNGSVRTIATGCGAGVGGYRWRCEWNGKYDPASGWTGGQNAPACGNIIQYQCRDANGNWQNQFRDFSGRANNACSNMWNCWAPSGRPNTFDPNYGAGYCRVFRCAYDPNPANYFYSPPGNNADDQCDKRCSAGTGQPAPNWTGPGSDDNCYIRPSFTVTCRFNNGVTVSQVVDNNGTFCTLPPGNTTTYSGTATQNRGLLCEVTTASSSGWQGTPPGKGVNGNVNQMRVTWNFNMITPAQACAQVGQRPYFHVYGGDVNANTSFMPCTAANTTTIRAWNNGAPSYYGSGSQLASIARGTIEGFTSASISTQRSFGLTFANTTGGWGGNYRGTLDCIPDTTLPLYGGSNVVSGVIAGQDWRNYGNQDVYITGNVTYPAAFSLANIPSLKIITNGNIYISSGVGQVNGIFMAKGKIFTCAVANGAGGLRSPTPQEMEDNCESQLRVNGSLIANQVKLLRIVGSAGYAPLDPRSGGGLATAAELLRYTPDNWIRDMVTPPPTPTDAPIESIVNLPPIL